LSDLGTVKNALFFWNNLGVLRSLEGDSWKLVEELAKEGEGEKEQVTHGELPNIFFVDCSRWAKREAKGIDVSFILQSLRRRRKLYRVSKLKVSNK